MKSISQKIRIALVSLMVALPLFGVAQASAQEQEFTPELYTSELSGFDVEVSGPGYEITGAAIEHYQTGDGEIVDIEGEFATLEVSFFDDEDTPEDSIDAYLAGLEQSGMEFEEIERDVDGDVTYSIVLIEYEGVEIIYYMQVTEDVTGNVDLFETILTGVEVVEDDLEAAQEEVTIDGNPFMENVDAADIVAVVEGGSTGTGSDSDDATPDATSEPATPETTVPFEIANVDLEVAGDFEVDDEKLGDETIEGYTLFNDDVFAAVAIGETGFDPIDVVTAFSEGLTSSYDDATIIEEFEDGDSAWVLYEVEYNGGTRIVFVYGDATTVEGFETLVSLEMDSADVASSIESVQDGLSIDGEPLLTTVDADEIASYVDGGTAGDEAEDVTPEATDDEAEDVTPEATDDVEEDASEEGNPRDDAKLPGSNGNGNSSETNSTNDDTTPEATDEPTEEPVGQSGDSSWTSPIYGNNVEWDPEVWFTDLEDEDFALSDEEDGYEFVSLNGDLTEVPTYLYIEFQPEDLTTTYFLDHWTSEEYLQHETSTGESFGGELLSSRTRSGSAGVVIRYTSSDANYILVREAVEMEDGTVMVLTIDAEEGEFATAYESAMGTVTVNSDPIFNVFSVSQIERITGD